MDLWLQNRLRLYSSKKLITMIIQQCSYVYDANKRLSFTQEIYLWCTTQFTDLRSHHKLLLATLAILQCLCCASMTELSDYDLELCAPYNHLPSTTEADCLPSTTGVELNVCFPPLELNIYHLPIVPDVYHLPLVLDIYHLPLILYVYHQPTELNIYHLPFATGQLRDIYHSLRLHHSPSVCWWLSPDFDCWSDNGNEKLRLSVITVLTSWRVLLYIVVK